MQLTIAVDLAKSVFQVAESGEPGRVIRNRRLSRSQFERYVKELPPSRVILEACGSAHYWGRQLQELGHTPVLLPPHLARCYRTRDKTDRADTKAMLEAERNEEILPVPVKSESQQCRASLHRLREGHKTTRTARINAVRGLLREFGVLIPLGASHVVPAVRALEPGRVPEPLRLELQEAAAEIRLQGERMEGIEAQLRDLDAADPQVARLRTIPGIGAITASALATFVGDFRRFRRARAFAGWLGITSKEHSSAKRRRLGAISKRGDEYLRQLLIHGARAELRAAGRGRRTPLRQWALQVRRRRGYNVATVALANKMARLAWVVATQERPFRTAA